MNLTTNTNTQNLFFKSDKKREFSDVLNEVQSYISSKYSSSHIPSESDTSSGDNPATGIAVSLIPLTVAVAVVIAAAKRRHK